MSKQTALKTAERISETSNLPIFVVSPRRGQYLVLDWCEWAQNDYHERTIIAEF